MRGIDVSVNLVDFVSAVALNVVNRNLFGGTNDGGAEGPEWGAEDAKHQSAETPRGGVWEVRPPQFAAPEIFLKFYPNMYILVVFSLLYL